MEIYIWAHCGDLHFGLIIVEIHINFLSYQCGDGLIIVEIYIWAHQCENKIWGTPPDRLKKEEVCFPKTTTTKKAKNSKYLESNK